MCQIAIRHGLPPPPYSHITIETLNTKSLPSPRPPCWYRHPYGPGMCRSRLSYIYTAAWYIFVAMSLALALLICRFLTAKRRYLLTIRWRKAICAVAVPATMMILIQLYADPTGYWFVPGLHRNHAWTCYMIYIDDMLHWMTGSVHFYHPNSL